MLENMVTFTTCLLVLKGFLKKPHKQRKSQRNLVTNSFTFSLIFLSSSLLFFGCAVSSLLLGFFSSAGPGSSLIAAWALCCGAPASAAAVLGLGSCSASGFPAAVVWARVVTVLGPSCSARAHSCRLGPAAAVLGLRVAAVLGLGSCSVCL